MCTTKMFAGDHAVIYSPAQRSTQPAPYFQYTAPSSFAKGPTDSNHTWKTASRRCHANNKWRHNNNLDSIKVPVMALISIKRYVVGIVKMSFSTGEYYKEEFMLVDIRMSKTPVQHDCVSTPEPNLFSPILVCAASYQCKLDNVKGRAPKTP